MRHGLSVPCSAPVSTPPWWPIGSPPPSRPAGTASFLWDHLFAFASGPVDVVAPWIALAAAAGAATPYPVWVGATWPGTRPFRRAARWDGVAPMRSDGRWEVADTAVVTARIAALRAPDAPPFDIAVPGETEGGDPARAERFAEHGAAGGWRRSTPGATAGPRTTSPAHGRCRPCRTGSKPAHDRWGRRTYAYPSC